MKTIIKLCFTWILAILIYSCVSLSDEQDVNPNNIGATAPDAPKNIRAESVGFFKALIVWDALTSSQLGKKISQKPAELSYYEIEYSSNSGFLDSKVVTSDTNVFNLKNLKSGTRYYVSVRAVNNNGTPKNASEKAFVKNLYFNTPIVPKITPPGNLRLKATDLIIDLTWEKPSSNGPSPEGTREVDLVNYLLRYRVKGNTNAPVQVEIPGEALSYKISSGIMPGTTYEVQLASKNELGEISVFSTGEMATQNPFVEASGPVMNLSSTIISGLMYRITWQSPLKLGKINSQTDAKIVSYVLSYSETPTFPENSMGTKTITLEATLKTTTINLSKGGATFYVRVFAINNAGPNGMSSTPKNITLNTLARATAPSPPSLNNPTVDSAKNVVLTWRYPANTGDSPQGDKNTGKIIKYTVEYTKSSIDPTFSTAGEGRRAITVTPATESLPSSRTLSFASGQLVGNTEYLFRVFATNNYVVESGKSNIVRITTPPNAVGPSKLTITSLVVATNSRDFELSWNAPLNNGTKSDGITEAARVEKYKYKIYAANPVSTTPVYEGEFPFDTSYKKTINYSGTPLAPNTAYNLVLLAINEVGGTSQPSDPSSFTTVRTLEVVPDPPTTTVVNKTNYNVNTGNGVLISWTATGSAGKDDAGKDKNLNTISYIIRYTKESTTLGVGNFTDKTKYSEQTNITSLSSTLLGLEGKTTYYVEVIADNGNSVNSKSTPLRTNFETASRATSPKPLTNLMVTTSLDNTGLAFFVFNWSIPDAGEYGKADNGIKDAEISRTNRAYTVRYSKNPTDNLSTVTDFTNFDNLVPSNDTTRGKESFDSTTRSWRAQALTPAAIYYYVVSVRSEASLEAHVRGSKTSASNANPPNTFTPISVTETSNKGELNVVWAEPQSNFGTLKNGNTAVVGDLAAYKLYYKKSTGATSAYIESSKEVLVSSTSNLLVLTGLEDYTTYDVFVSARNRDSGYSRTPPPSVRSGKTKSGVTAPTAPMSFSKSSRVVPTKSTINLIWLSPADNGFENDGKTKSASVKYELEFKKTGDSWTDLDPNKVVSEAIPNSNSNFYEVKNLISSTSYDFRLYALNTWDSTKKSSPTPTITVLTTSGATAPATPSNLRLVPSTPPQAPNPTPTSIIVEWAASTSKGFDRGGQNEASDPKYVLEYKLNTAATSWTPTSPQVVLRNKVINLQFPYTDYAFRVKALNADDNTVESSYSAVTIIKTAEASTVPDSPGTTIIHPTIVKTSTSITIQWDLPSNRGNNKKGIRNTRVKYEVEYKLSATANWDNAKTSEASELSAFTAKGLIPNTDYNFRVKTVNFDDDTKKSAPNSEITFTTTSGASAPSEPLNLRDNTANVPSLDRNNQIAIAWSASTELGSDKDGNSQTIAVKYQVRYRTSSKMGSSAGAWQKSIFFLSTSYTADKLIPGTSYDFQVKAQNGSDATAESAYTSTPPLVINTVSGATAPTVPLNIRLIPDTSSARNPTKNTITIQWDKPSSNGTSRTNTGDSNEPLYIISYRKDGTSTSIISPPQNTRTFKAVSLLSSTNYLFKIRAQNVEDNTKLSDYTSEGSFTTLSGSAPPDIPQNLRQNTITITAIGVQWDMSTFFGKDQNGNDIGSSNPPKYILQYRKRISPPPSWTSTPLQTAASFTVDPITPSVTYQFRVQSVSALDNTQKSQFSAIIELSSSSGATAPGLPTNIRKTSTTSSQITIAWDEPVDKGKNRQGQIEKNPPKYRVEYKESSVGTWTLGNQSSVSSTYTTPSSLKAFTFYDFRVRSISFSDRSKVGTYVVIQSIRTEAVTSAPSTPGQPTLVASTTSSPNPTINSIKISWTESTFKGNDPGGTELTISPKYYVRYKKPTDADTAWSSWGLSTTSGTNLDYTASGLDSYQEYQFQVKAQNAMTSSLESSPTSPVTFSTISAATAPTVPQNINATTKTSTQITIGWSVPTNYGANKQGQSQTTSEPKYEVQYRETGSATWLASGSDLSTKTHTVINLNPFTAYDFQVRAINSIDNSKIGQYASLGAIKTEAVTSAPSTPGQPTLVASTTSSPNPTINSIKISWTESIFKGNDPGGTELTTSPKYYVRYKKPTDADTAWSSWGLSTTSGTNLDYTASGLDSYQEYQFQVKAQNAMTSSLESSPTSSVTFRTSSSALPPSAPRNVRENTGTPAKTSTEITIVWDAPQNYGTDRQGNPQITSEPKYEVQYKELGSATWLASGSDLSAKTHTVSPLTPFTSYNFQVRAINSSDANKTSVYQAASIAIKTLEGFEAPTAPQLVTLVASTTSSPNPMTNSIKISWTAPTSYGKNEYGMEMKTLTPPVLPKYTIRHRISRAVGVTEGAWSNPSTAQDLTVYTEFGLEPYKYYDFEVTAINAKKTTLTTVALSNLRVRTASAATTPDIPQDFRFSPSISSRTEVDLAWTASTPVKNPDGSAGTVVYFIEKKKTAESTWASVGSTELLTMKANFLTADTAYDFRIKAKNKDVTTLESDYAATLSDSTLPIDLATLNPKLTTANRTGIGSSTTPGTKLNTGTDDRLILDVINTYLTNNLSEAELNYILENLTNYRLTIYVGDNRDTPASLVQRFSKITNWDGADVGLSTPLLLTPDPYTGTTVDLKFDFKLKVRHGSDPVSNTKNTLSITDSHSATANTYGAIRGMTVESKITP